MAQCFMHWSMWIGTFFSVYQDLQKDYLSKNLHLGIATAKQKAGPEIDPASIVLDL